MGRQQMRRAALFALLATLMLSGCYYDPATGYTYAYPPPPAYGYPQSSPEGGPPAPGYGAPAADYGAPPGGGYGGPPAADYGAPPPGGYGAAPGGYGAAPGGYGAAPGGYGGPPPPGYGAAPAAGAAITRGQFVEQAAQRAQSRNRDPQLAAQRAGALFDQIDTGHTGVVTRAQIRAWREAHRAAPYSGGPPPEQY